MAVTDLPLQEWNLKLVPGQKEEAVIVGQKNLCCVKREQNISILFSVLFIVKLNILIPILSQIIKISLPTKKKKSHFFF